MEVEVWSNKVLYCSWMKAQSRGGTTSNLTVAHSVQSHDIFVAIIHEELIT